MFVRVHRQWAAVMDVSNTAYFSSSAPTVHSGLNKQADFNGVPFTPFSPADRCYTTNVYTHSESVNPRLHRGASFFFIPSLSLSICQSFCLLLRWRLTASSWCLSFKPLTPPTVCPDARTNTNTCKVLFQGLQQVSQPRRLPANDGEK